MQTDDYPNGDLALAMLLDLMVALGSAKALPGKRLDTIIEMGCDLIGRDRKNAGRRERLRSYKAAWRKS